MKMPVISTIREKLIIIIMIICITALTLSGTAYCVWSYLQFRDSMVHNLQVQAKIMANNSAAAVLFEDSTHAAEILDSLNAMTPVVSCYIYTNQSERFASYIRDGYTESGEIALQPGGYMFTWDHLTVFEPLNCKNETVGTLVLRSDLAPLYKNFQTNVFIILWVTGIVSMAGYLLAMRLQSIISRPILNLAALAKKVSEKRDYTQRAQEESADGEMGTLVKAFNQMLDEIQVEMDERIKAQKELMNHRDHLEEIVNERTKKLKLINRQMELAAEKASLMAKEADEANKAKSEFLANMSHEIRTPMNAIIGFSELLSEEELTDDQKSYINTILNSGKNLLQLINDILDFSKIEAGKLETEIIECKLEEFLGDLNSFLRPMALEKGLDFDILRCSELPTIILTDPVRLRQCLVNLVSNAIKFTAKGHVYINIATESQDGMDYIRFDVEDTGIGIPKEKQLAIFEAFTQADGSTTRKFGGTGLGLTITKQLTQLLGGHISIKSEVDKGSVFTILLPAGVKLDQVEHHNSYDIIEEIIESESPKEQPKASHESLRILVAEDAPANQALIKTLLERMGHQFTIIENGALAVQAWEKDTYDLILMDMMMPEMNGYEATQKLRAKGCTLPIIALTANAMKGDREKCLEAGCDEYLSKPIQRVKLEELLKNLANARKAVTTGLN